MQSLLTRRDNARRIAIAVTVNLLCMSILMKCGVGGDVMADAQQWLEEGMELFKQGRYEECIERMYWVLQKDAEHYTAWFYVGAAYAQMHDYENAAHAFFKAAEIQPDSCRAHYNLGAAYEALGSYMEAEREYEQALLLNPEYENAKKGLMRLRQLHRETYRKSPWDQPQQPQA
jgi:tetratricopeptide (TPR) repeat protein